MRIEHVAVYASNPENMRDFFVKYFGAESDSGYRNLTTGFRSFFLSFDDGARLEIMYSPKMQDEGKSLFRTGYVHIAVSVGSRDRVDEISEELDRAGFKILSGPRVTGDGYYESCILGPENNLIEITV
jgi:lactoylglutathione lyase